MKLQEKQRESNVRYEMRTPKYTETDTLIIIIQK